MKHLDSKIIRYFFILPVLLFMVQFGVVLLHQHSADSWYDDNDIRHHLSTDTPHKLDSQNKLFSNAPDSVAAHTALFRPVAPALIPFAQRAASLVALIPFDTPRLSLKRAPPA